MSGHNPNAGENHMNYSSGDAGTINDSKGVEDGLSMIQGGSCKNAEKVSQNQRPKANSHTKMGYRIGT